MIRVRPASVVALLCGAAALMPVPAMVQASPSAVAPAPAGRVALPYARFTLPNGLTTIVYTDHTVPSVHVGVWYRTGSKDEPVGKTGFAHLFEHLMFQQTTHRQEDFMAAMSRAGASGMNGSTTADYTNYFQTVPTNALDTALWLESDRMGYLAGGITQAVLDEQRAVVKNEKRQNASPVDDEVERRFMAQYYPPNHPYAHTVIGSMADLDAASLADVRGWFRDHYGAANAVLILSGDIDPAVAKEKVTRYFGGLRSGAPYVRPAQQTPSFTRIKRDVMYVDNAQPRLTRTWPVTNDDPRGNAFLQVGARTMTGVHDSAFVRYLTKEAKVATAVEAGLQPQRLDSKFSIAMMLAPGVTPERADAALDAALRSFFRDGPSPVDLAELRGGTDTSVLRALDDTRMVADFLMNGEIVGGDPDLFLKQREWVLESTPELVRTAARKWLDRPYFEEVILPTPKGGAAWDRQKVAGTPPAAAGAAAVGAPAATAMGAPAATAAVEDAPTQADVDRTHMPAPGPLKTTITLPPITRITLPNGMKLVIAERHKVPFVDMAMVFDTGSIADAGYAPGAARAAFQLLEAGTSKYDRQGIAARSIALGVPLTATDGKRASTVAWSARTRQLDEAFALAANVLRNPTYPAKEVTSAVNATVAGLKAQQDPAGRAELLFTHALWGGTDLRGRLARPEDFRTLNRNAVVRYHDHEIGPANATLVMVGDVTPQQARALAEKYFGDWRRNTPFSAKALPPTPPQTPRIILLDSPGAAQSSVIVGEIVPPFDPATNAAEQLANAVLANGTTGRLNMNLREAKGWTYGIGGGISADYEGGRVFTAGGAIETDKTAEALTEIRKEVSAITTTSPVTAAELEDVRNAAIRSVPLGIAGAGGMLDTLTANVASKLPPERIATSAERLASVTLDQARAATMRLYDPSRLSWLIVGDLKAIEPSIRKLNLAPIEVWDAKGTRLR